jgi:two-component system sensor histidine kinase/response regulator
LADVPIGSVSKMHPELPVPVTACSAPAVPDVVKPNPELVILVADDDEVNQIVAAGMLEAIGYQSQLVDDGVEVVAATEQTRYAAVLMDCQMPKLDGYEATRAIRRREKGGTHIPIIALTAFSLPGGREACLAAGMDDYLTKPITIKILREALARHIDAPVGPTE